MTGVQTCALPISREAAYARLITPAAKFLICKTAPAFVFEAMECLGGNGYVEESIMPRLCREAPVNAIWEGSGNVMCPDVLRALKGEEERNLFRTLAHDAGVEDRYPNTEPPNEALARVTVERLALLASVAALRTSAPPMVADQFLRTRLARSHGALFGAHDIDPAAIATLLQRALPES